MKNAILILLTALTIYADPLPPDPEFTYTLKKENPTHFKYFSFGGCGCFLPTTPELSLGCRTLNSQHVWDVQAGTSINFSYTWGQLSYLYHFFPNKGTYETPYLGISLAVSRMGAGFQDQRSILIPTSLPPYFPNLPITVGYQWGKDDQHQFVQFQVTPQMTSTLSYGIGF